jgi:hypothetical protein
MDPTPLADTVQTAVDTVYVMQSEATDTGFPVWLTAVSTTLYFVATCFIFWKTWEQADAAETSAEAAVEANKVVARSQFYPSLDMEVDGTYNITGWLVNVQIKPLSENPALDTAVFCKVKEVRTFAGDDDLKEQEEQLVWHSHSLRLGDLTEGEVYPTFQTSRDVQVMSILLRFTDVLSNTYYLLRQYGPINREEKPELIREWSTGLSAHPKYMPEHENGNVILRPREFREVKDPYEDPPEPIRLFNRFGRNTKRADAPSRAW